MYRHKFKKRFLAAFITVLAINLSACASGSPGSSDSAPSSGSSDPSKIADPTIVDETPVPSSSSVPQAPKENVVLRDNTPYVPKQEAPGIESYSNDVTSVDVSNSSKGYFMAKYFGSNPKVKLTITGPDKIQYKYDLKEKDYIAFPFTAGDGTYSIGVYENVSGTTYSAAMKVDVEVELEDEFQPF